MEQHPGSSAPELPLLAEMCNTGSQLAKKSRALFPALKAGLHCDSMADYSLEVPPGPFPSSKSWAPLRLLTEEVLCGTLRAFPSSKSWAPLRHSC